MNKAEAAIEEFTSKHGKHDTTVHSHVKPAITHEHITPTQHENAVTAIDREVIQEHHHTTVQPIRHREVLPEQHQHNIIPVEHKEHRHGDSSAVKARLEQEAAQFKDVSEVGKVEHTHSVLPVVAGEHHHHHVHEYIQPIIQKETIQPSVVHTVVPIHEVHYNEAKHHAASALPAISLADWKKQGGALTGREEKTDHFQGEPEAETAEQHARHIGPHHHGIVGDGVTDTTTASKGNVLRKNNDPRYVDDGSSRGNHVGRDAGIVGAGGVGGASALESRRERDINDSRTPQTVNSSAVNNNGPAISSPISDGSRLSNQSDSAASTGTNRTSLSGGSPSQNSKYADTHLGSRMDEASPVVGDSGKRSNMESANITKKNTLTKDAPQERKPSLLQRLNPLKDNEN